MKSPSVNNNASTDADLLWDSEQLQHPHAQPDKRARVRRMFDAIAPTYERVNRLFSVGRDRAWRRKAVALTHAAEHDRVLDIACGTGDLTRTFARLKHRPKTIVGTDFAMGMLSLAAQRTPAETSWGQADALALPFASGSFTITGCAFGVRNFTDLKAGLREMHRVLGDGGRAVILEFTRPTHHGMRKLYEFYSSRVMPWGAALVSRDRTGAYRYLPSSVVSFVDAETMCEHLREAGFSGVSATPMTFGVVTIYLATR